MNTMKLQIALSNLEHLDNQLYTLAFHSKKLRQSDYANLKQTIEYTKGHLLELAKEAQ